jgi:hypothetical protein
MIAPDSMVRVDVDDTVTFPSRTRFSPLHVASAAVMVTSEDTNGARLLTTRRTNNAIARERIASASDWTISMQG